MSAPLNGSICDLTGMTKRIKKSGELADWMRSDPNEQPDPVELAKGAIKPSDFLPTAPAKYEGTEVRVRIQSDMSYLLSAPSLIIEREMDRLSQQSSLTDSDVKRFRQLVDSLVALSREKRALDTKQRFDELSDAELEQELRKYATEQKDS